MILTRYGSTPYGTFGQLLVKNVKFYTVERQWKNNTPMVSCIPNGDYKLLWRPTTTSVPTAMQGHTWYVEGGTVGLEPDIDCQRYRVAIHIGNTEGDVSGCIAVGNRLTMLDSQWAVAGSRHSMLELFDLVGPVDTTLEIKQEPCC